ncbi:MAG TPA: hypothetical protein VMS65_04380 [Polyangiaceae bacterium]|nr:hypothetical protein [Polyangiaceae bacterium]
MARSVSMEARWIALFTPTTLCVVLGCATSGSTWVSQPEPGVFANDELALTAAEHPIDALDEPKTSRFVSELESDSQPRSRPRLDRTVTLGEIEVAPPARGEAAPVYDRAPVTVIVNNTVVTQPNTYDGYYPAGFVGDFRPARGGGARPTPHRGSSAPASRPGQDWPAIPNHGTSFPFKTAPASPWQ